jgi:hypothetical protein
MLDPAAWRAAGWVYRASGIPGPVDSPAGSMAKQSS